MLEEKWQECHTSNGQNIQIEGILAINLLDKVYEGDTYTEKEFVYDFEHPNGNHSRMLTMLRQHFLLNILSER